jgi:hypothetical protein
MAEKQSSVGDAANGLGILAAIICFFIGFDKGAWVGGFITAAVAYGGVRLAFVAVSLLWRWLIISAVLLLLLASLVNRWNWLAGLMN